MWHERQKALVCLERSKCSERPQTPQENRQGRKEREKRKNLPANADCYRRPRQNEHKEHNRDSQKTVKERKKGLAADWKL